VAGRQRYSVLWLLLAVRPLLIQQQQQRDQQQQQQVAASDLDCALGAADIARAWQVMQQQQELNDVKLAVMLHGGSVADTYCSAVTHLVLWPAQQQQQQQQRELQYGQHCRSNVLTCHQHDQQVRLPCLLEAVPLEGSTACKQAAQLACRQQGFLPGHSGTGDIKAEQLAAAVGNCCYCRC